MPRPSKLTQQRQQAICERLRNGSTRRAAFVGAGVAETTFYDWMAANPAFAEAIARAEAECQYARETIVTSLTGKPDVDSANARWWLERRRRADYGPELNLRAIPTEQLRELLPADTQPTALPSARDLTPDEEDAIDSVFRDRE